MDSHQSPVTFLIAWFISFVWPHIANSDPGLEGWRRDILLLKIRSCTILFVVFFDWLLRVLPPYFRTMTWRIRPIIPLLILFSFGFLRFLTRPKYFLVNHVLVIGVTAAMLYLSFWRIFHFSSFLLARWCISIFSSCCRNAYVFNFLFNGTIYSTG